MKKTLLAACVLMSAAATAQTIALPDNATATFAPGTAVLVNTFDENGKLVQQVVEIPETQEMKEAKQKLFRAGEATVKLTVNIEPDENGENDVPFMVSLMKDAQAGWNSFKSNSEFNVPAGQYVLQVAFKNNYQLFYDIDLTEDKTMTVNADMATNKATTQSVLPNGDAIVMPTYIDGMIQGNPYNCAYLYVGQYIHYKGLSRAGYSINIGRGGPEYYQTKLPMATNITTADGTFIWNIMAVTTASDILGISVFNPANEVPADGIIHNSAADYVQVKGQFENTPAWTSAENRVKCRFNCYRPSNVSQDELTYTTNGMANYYLCGPIFALDQYNSLMSIEKMQAGGEDDATGIVSPSMARGENGLICYDTQINNPYSDTTTITNMLQVAPDFSYEADKVNPVFGSSTPICVTGFSGYRDSNWQYHPVFGIAGYYGNLGESFTVDRALSKIRVNINGTDNDFTDYASYQQWYLTNINNMKGDLTYTFINDNVRTDGIKGSTECQIAYNGDDMENLTLPTVQRMMFQDADGLPANKFKEADGTVLLAAGNYKFAIETIQMGGFRPTFCYYTVSRADVKLEVAPNGTTDFSVLPLAESNMLPDPSYGINWSGNLSELKTQSANGWFDVRITVTNDNGTAQTQTVSPAFYVESLKGVGVDGIEMESEGEARYFNLQGIEIEKPAEGICIRQLNGKAEKIAIR